VIQLRAHVSETNVKIQKASAILLVAAAAILGDLARPKQDRASDGG